MKLKIMLAISVMTVLLVACSGNNSDEGSSVSEKAASDIKSLVHDYSVGNLESQNASINSQQLVVTDNNGKEVAYDLPEQEFFVSIAPYVNQTHP